MPKHKNYSIEFKEQTASLIVDDGYTIFEAQEATGVGKSALHRWAQQLREERAGKMPNTSTALMEEHQEIQRLKKKIKQLEREKDILKKATALLVSSSLSV